MNTEKDRDYWTICVNYGSVFEMSPPAKVRFLRDRRGFLDFGYVDAKGQMSGLTISLCPPEVYRFIFDTEESAWRAYARSNASPIGYLSGHWEGVEHRTREFTALAAREDVPEYARAILRAEVERAERLRTQIPIVEED